MDSNQTFAAVHFTQYLDFKPLIHEFLKWTLPNLNLDVLIVANRHISTESKAEESSSSPESHHVMFAKISVLV